MATVGTSVTLLDWIKRRDPDGSIADIVELQTQANEVMLDMRWKEGNLPTGHRTTMRTGLPKGARRLLNTGVPTEKSTTTQVDEQCGILETRGQVDCDIASLESDAAAFRLSEAIPTIEGLTETFVSTFFYGNSASSPAQFTGLSPRYGAISGATNAMNIIDAGGTGSDNTSVWLIGWGDQTIHGIFPKGSTAGLQHKDLGEQDAFDSSNNRFRAYLDWYQMKAGLALKDWRYGVRICNIDVSDLVGSSGTQNAQQLIKFMSRAIDRLPKRGMCTPVFYCTRTVKSLLRVQALDKSQNAIGVIAATNQFGETIETMTVFGIPVRTVDQLLETEARVV